MGRQQYLARLALGRSPFEDLEADAPPPNARSPKTHEISGSGHSPEQIFDIKGRPSNPETKARNAEQRRAQNDVLALFGVVESYDQADRIAEAKLREIRKARHEVLIQEDSYGEGVDIVAKIARETFMWWPTALTIKFQAGIYPATAAFAFVLSDQLRLVGASGLKHAVLTVFAGAPAYLLHTTAQNLLGSLLEEAVSQIQGEIVRRFRRSRAGNKANVLALVFYNVLLIGLDALLLPLEYYSVAQMLGLAPALPLFPNWTSFTPSHPSSVHNFPGSSGSRFSIIRHLCKPSVLMLVHSFVTKSQGDELPILPMFTSFMYEPVDTHPSQVAKPNPHNDVWGWVVYHGYLLRSNFLRWCGWEMQTIQKFPDSEESLQNHHSRGSIGVGGQSSILDGRLSIYRSTALSQLPPRYLAEVLDNILSRLLTLPLTCLVYRSVAVSYLTSPLPKTSFALSAYGPSPFSFGTSQGWYELCLYGSKIGLAIAAHTLVEAGLFFGVYGATRWYGTGRFDWGARGRIGDVRYRQADAEEEEEQTT